MDIDYIRLEVETSGVDRDKEFEVDREIIDGVEPHIMHDVWDSIFGETGRGVQW